MRIHSGAAGSPLHRYFFKAGLSQPLKSQIVGSPCQIQKGPQGVKRRQYPLTFCETGTEKNCRKRAIVFPGPPIEAAIQYFAAVIA
jgi:hypothetical protein